MGVRWRCRNSTPGETGQSSSSPSTTVTRPSSHSASKRSIPEIRKMVREIASVELDDGKRTIPVYRGWCACVDVSGRRGTCRRLRSWQRRDHPLRCTLQTTLRPHSVILFSHGNPVRRLVEEELINPAHVIQVGLRGPTSTDLETLSWARAQGVRYHMMAEVEQRGWGPVLDDVIREAKESAPHVFISFDVDVIDPAFVPGTSTPETGRSLHS